jgi:hypothetical protein
MITYTTPTQQAMARIATAPVTSEQARPIASDDELELLFQRSSANFYSALRAVYNLGREHGPL